MIKVKTFGSDDIIEKHEHSGSIGAFLDKFSPSWRNEVIQPIIISKNGNDVCSLDWDNTFITNNDDVEFLILPRGLEALAIGALVASLVVSAVMMTRKVSIQQRQQTKQGGKIELSELKSNNARVGGTVPELFGRYRTFPAYVTEPRRYFVNKRAQEVLSLLCVGVGNYQIEQVKAGETLLSELADTTYTQFNPNANVGKYAEAWHTVPEVGATASGSAGLDLSVDQVPRSQMQNTASVGGYSLNGKTITRKDGTSWNENWSNKVIIEVSDVERFGVVQNSEGKIQIVFTATEMTDEEILDLCEPVINTFYNRYIYSRTENRVIVRYRYGDWIFLDFDSQDIYTVGQNIVFYKSLRFDVSSFLGSSLIIQGDTSYSLQDIAQDGIRYISGGQDVPIYTNKFAATPEGVKTSKIEVDIFFSQGLCWIGDDGSISSNTVNLQIEITDKATNEVFFSAYRTYTEATNDQIGFTEVIDLPKHCEPLVRMRRLERGSDSVQSHSTVTWYGLKSRLPDVVRYPRWTTLGVTLRSGGKISAQSESTLNLVATRILPELNNDGTWSAPKPTRHISSFTRYIAEEIGYTVNDINLAEMQRLNNTYWKPRGETFDYVFDETTVKDAIEMAFNAGMSSLTISNGKIKPVRNEKRTILEQSYSAQNIVGELTQSFRARKADDYDGVEVEYVDPETFDKKVVQCLLPDSQGFKIRKLSINGVTSKNRAYIIGMREALTDRYINKEFSFKTEMDGFNSQYMSYIAVIDDVPTFGQSSLILSVDGNEITLSDNVNGSPTVFAFRDRKGKLIGTFNIISFNKNKVIVNFGNEKPIVNINYELPHAYLGTSARWAHKCLVSDISPNGIDSATIKAVNYDDRIYDYDNTELYK